MFAVVRIRGSAGRRKDLEDTLKILRLKKPNNCVIVPETKEYIGMLKKAKDYITWGKIDKKILSKLFEKRGRILGDRAIDKKNLKEITGFDSFEKFSEALIKQKVKLKDYKEIKPVFRLSPPRHGYKSTRLPFPKGDLGDRRDKINQLLERMI
jgi:large subunit ribosomal protein L30